MAAAPSRLDAVVSLAKRRGFVFPSGEIYGGTRSAWDYGPLGVELKENIKRQWWRAIVQSRDDVVGLDSSVILPRQVWVASGHVGVFTDPLTECLSCHKREFTESSGAPMISVTHYITRDGQMLADVSPRRYFCTACHVPQAAVTPPVENTFIDMSQMGVEHAGDK